MVLCNPAALLETSSPFCLRGNDSPGAVPPRKPSSTANLFLLTYNTRHYFSTASSTQPSLYICRKYVTIHMYPLGTPHGDGGINQQLPDPVSKKSSATLESGVVEVLLFGAISRPIFAAATAAAASADRARMTSPGSSSFRTTYLVRATYSKEDVSKASPLPSSVRYLERPKHDTNNLWPARAILHNQLRENILYRFFVSYWKIFLVFFVCFLLRQPKSTPPHTREESVVPRHQLISPPGL